MTIIADKLKAAGVKIPSMQERVWRIVRDNPGGITSARATDIMGVAVTSGSVSSLLSQMEKRKMVSSRPERRRVVGPRGSTIERDVKVYYTTMREYELLPRPRKETAASRARDATKAVVEQVKAVPQPLIGSDYYLDPSDGKVKRYALAPTTVIPDEKPRFVPPPLPSALKYVEHMTIAQARSVYAILHDMFGDKA